jgi:hypothetical protein
MSDNPHKIKETMGIYINNLAQDLKQAKRLLNTLRGCLGNDKRL